MSTFLHKLQTELQDLNRTRRVLLALSGGMDSVLLLHSVRQINLQHGKGWQLQAVHVNHAISQYANDWERFCLQLCASNEIPLHIERLQLANIDGSSLEARAREARYQAFAGLLRDGDVLLMAHHADDQLETMLLRLMRGAGPAGLAGMPRSRDLGSGRLLRPLLDFPKAELQDYAAHEGLDWVEDDSNANNRFDRNFCRNQVMPLLASRWPGYRDSWQKSRQLTSEAAQLLNELAQADFSALVATDPSIINLQKLQNLSKARQRNVLRYWFTLLGVPEVGWNLLTRLSEEIIPARDDAPASLQGHGIRLQRYQQQLFALRELPQLQATDLHWLPMQQPVFALPDNGQLSCVDAQPKLRLSGQSEFTVRYRAGGERCQLDKRPRKSLKAILQEAQIPPWLRDRLPLLYQGDELVCVPGIGVASGHVAGDKEQGLAIAWQPPQLSYRRN